MHKVLAANVILRGVSILIVWAQLKKPFQSANQTAELEEALYATFQTVSTKKCF